MIGKLFKSAFGSSEPKNVPEGKRIYAVGDVHGRADLLKEMQRLIAEDVAVKGAEENIVVYLGDYVDRGLNSKEVLDQLLEETISGVRSICLKGNHEQAMLDFLKDHKYGRIWKKFGGLETLLSYGVVPPSDTDDEEAFVSARDDFSEKLPSSHLEFLLGLKMHVTFGDYMFVHAGVRPGVDLDNQREEDLLWIRGDFLRSKEDFGKVIVHGHTPQAKAEILSNRINVDTGAYITNTLTAVVLEGDTRTILSANPVATSPLG